MKDKGRAIRHTTEDRIFLGLDWAILSLFFIIMVYPLLFIIASSFSGGMNNMTLWLIPRRFTLEGYKAIIQFKNIWIGFQNSGIYVAMGTVIAMAVTICCAYPLSRTDFKGARPMMLLCVFTMYFSGGLIPTYMWIRQLGLIDSLWVIVLPGSLSVYNMIVMRTYFNTQIPRELLDASSIDGCGDLRFLLSIVLPLSGPILAVIGLYYAVGLWNSYFSPMIYLTSRTKYPLTIFLREILVLNQFAHGMESSLTSELESMLATRADLMKYALAVVSCLPMMILYPFVQRFFVKGIMVGAIKG